MKLTPQQIRSLEEIDKTGAFSLSGDDLSEINLHATLDFHAKLDLANLLAEHEKVQVGMIIPSLLNKDEKVCLDLLLALSGGTSFSDPSRDSDSSMVEPGDIGLFSESDWNDCDPAHGAVMAGIRQIFPTADIDSPMECYHTFSKAQAPIILGLLDQSPFSYDSDVRPNAAAAKKLIAQFTEAQTVEDAEKVLLHPQLPVVSTPAKFERLLPVFIGGKPHYEVTKADGKISIYDEDFKLKHSTWISSYNGKTGHEPIYYPQSSDQVVLLGHWEVPSLHNLVTGQVTSIPENPSSMHSMRSHGGGSVDHQRVAAFDTDGKTAVVAYNPPRIRMIDVNTGKVTVEYHWEVTTRIVGVLLKGADVQLITPFNIITVHPDGTSDPTPIRIAPDLPKKERIIENFDGKQFTLRTEGITAQVDMSTGTGVVQPLAITLTTSTTDKQVLVGGKPVAEHRSLKPDLTILPLHHPTKALIAHHGKTYSADALTLDITKPLENHTLTKVVSTATIQPVLSKPIADPSTEDCKEFLTELYTKSNVYGFTGPKTPPARKDWKRTRKYSEGGIVFRDFTHKDGFDATLAERGGRLALEKATGLTPIVSAPESSSMDF